MAWQKNMGSDLPEQLYPARVLYNAGGSIATPPEDDDVISTLLICDICGRPFNDKAEVVRMDNKVLHSECIDES